MQEQLQKYEIVLKDIFTTEHLPAIVCLLNALRPYNENRVLDNEFNTVVAAAKLDGMDELIRKVIEYTGQTNTQ